MALATAPASAEVCHKSGEKAGPLGTTCSYSCTFGETALNLGPGRLCPLTTQASAAGLSTPPRQTGGSCFKTGERTTGMSKQCIYDCTGREKVETIGAAQLCPLTAR